MSDQQKAQGEAPAIIGQADAAISAPGTDAPEGGPVLLDQRIQRRRKVRDRLLMLAALVAAAAMGAAVFAFVSDGSDGKQAGKDVPTPSATSSWSADRTTGSTTPTVVPTPREVEDGVPVGYPHTPEGAVSAIARFNDVFDPLTPDAAEKQGRVIAVPREKNLLGLGLRDSSERLRKKYQLPVDGESDDGTYYISTSRAYQISGASANRVTVWLLSDVEVSVRGVPRSYTEVTGSVLIWANGDWKLSVVEETTGTEPAKATPDTSEAAQAGWKTLVYAK
ncbi:MULTISPECIES: hypothetical protein [unclassified Streptomyces]|uniref:hypothetical protein n=1 Tax=unclassified Streptomyces TaxID=2593676 RepID=UPI00336A132D